MILVTGGAGYIGSHTIVALSQAGYEVMVVDNFVNSDVKALCALEEITGKIIRFHQFDLCDDIQVKRLFHLYKFEAVIHFAGLKAVGESVRRPLRYYQNNLISTLNLLRCMKKWKCKKLIFSSSATVYGNPEQTPIPETATVQATNPYGRTKMMIEEILKDVAHADIGWQITSLRYFNPVGAHESGKIGEHPKGIPNNLMPYLLQVAVGKLPKLRIFGNDYNTKDGTGVRDYIHVMDLAEGHVAALTGLQPGFHTYNLGRGTGYSVLEMVKAVSQASGRNIPFEIVNRRPGDCAEVVADPRKAEEELSWKCTRDITKICQDAWRWQQSHPDGY
jgi:UDP-glucose 4-epimerase